MKIVAGTDFSEQAQQAATLAARLAARLGDELVLVHALEPWVVTGPEVAPPPQWIEQAKADAKARLERAAEELKTKARVETRLVDGFADTCLRELAQELKPRFVVVGTHGRRGVQRLLVGSVAMRVAQSGEQPVLVLRGDNPGLLSWLEGSRPLKVLLAIDETRASDSVIAWAKALREHVVADLTFIHLYWPPEEHERLGTRPARGFFEPDLEVLRVLQRDLTQKIGTIPGQGELQILVRPQWGRIGDALSLAAHELGADVLVTGTHHRGLGERIARGAVSRSVLATADVPVVCVPASVAAAPAPKDVRRVLAATDLSDIGNAAVRYAYALLHGKGGTVDVACVRDGRETKEDVRALEVRLRALIPSDAADSGIVTRVRILEGSDVPTELVQQAALLGSDVVCVGSHGRSGLKKALLGSVASAVLERSARPVMVVRAAAQ